MYNYNQKFYKDSLFLQIKDIIGNPKNFIKSNNLKKKIISEELKKLSILATHTDIFLNQNDFFIEVVEKERNHFIELLKKKLEAKIRSNSGDIKKSILDSINAVLKTLELNGYLTESPNAEEILKSLNLSHIFFIIISVCISCVNLDSYDEERYDNVYELAHNEIIRALFLSSFRQEFILFLVHSILIYTKSIQHTEILRKFYYMKDKIAQSQVCFIKTSLQLHLIFNEVFEIETRNIQSRIKLTVFPVPQKLIENHINPPHIPEIVKPEVDYKSFKDEMKLSKPVKDGISRVELSEKTIKGLNLTQDKRFKINKDTIKLFEYIDTLTNIQLLEKIDTLPFTPLHYLRHLEYKIKDLETKTTEEISNNIAKEYKAKINDKEYTPDLKEYIIKKYKLTEKIFDDHTNLYNLKKELKKRTRLRILHNTIIEFAKVFTGFPIYFLNSYDYRLRMYSWNFMFGRTTGIYKYLVAEDREMKLTVNGLYTMLKAYYEHIPDKQKELQRLIDNNQHNQILSLIDKTDFSLTYLIENSKSFIYLFLLGQEIKNNYRKNSMKTGFMVEIDQKSSGVVLFSILMGDKNLAINSNLISRTPQDPPKKLMAESNNYFKNLIKPESLKTLVDNRKLMKYLLMCFTYNETFIGRLTRIKSYSIDYKDAVIIAREFPNFIETVFPNIYKKRTKLNEIIKYFIKHCRKIQYYTLDGSRVSWEIFTVTKKSTKDKYVHPISGGYIDYRRYIAETEKLDQSKMVRGFIPGFIHSIDAAIMRKILIEVYESINYLIVHLHDSLQFHPNHYEIIIKSIRKVYLDPSLTTVLDDCLLDELRNNLLKENVEGLEILIKEFKDIDYEVLELHEETLIIENMFPFE